MQGDSVSYLIPFHWVGLFAVVAVFTVMFALGLMLGRQAIEAALRCPLVLLAVIFAVVVPLPALAVVALKLLGLKGPVAAGILLMAISPGAPVALRRALDAGGQVHFAQVLHLSIVLLAVVTVPTTVVILDWIFGANFSVRPWDIGRQVFVAQLLPLMLGATLRAAHPTAAERFEPRLSRIGNGLLIVLGLMALVDAPSVIAEVGWEPTLAGLITTACALAIGAAFVGGHADLRPAAAVAVAMRNPGLALVIARFNHAQPKVTAAVIGYAIGLTLTMTVFLAIMKRRRLEGK